jgi:hypothetical protein
MHAYRHLVLVKVMPGVSKRDEAIMSHLVQKRPVSGAPEATHAKTIFRRVQFTAYPRAGYSGRMASNRPVSLPIPKAAIAFRPEHLDFRRGIHVGNLNDNERITRILKLELESRYGEPFVTERWGRGVYWQWIGYLPRANRAAKPISSQASFGCSKFFLMVDTEEKAFKSGLQVERGYVKAPRESRHVGLCSDWDWHRLVNSLNPAGPMERELKRLVCREGFRIRAGVWTAPLTFSRANWPGAMNLRKRLAAITPSQWAAFQLYYSMAEEEVRSSNGLDLVEAMLAVFHEVTPAMNLCMQTRIEDHSTA